MTAIYLDVPFVSQLGFGSPSDPRDDPTGCWYASACMMGYYFEAGPRFGVPELYRRRLGTSPSGEVLIGHEPITERYDQRFMQREHLVAIPDDPKKRWRTAALADQLRAYGPLLFYWTKTNKKGASYGHASVLIGANTHGSRLIYHDPENSPNSKMTTSDFNRLFMWGLRYGGLLRKDRPAQSQKLVTAGPTGGWK